jgi:hypothetical protein
MGSSMLQFQFRKEAEGLRSGPPPYNKYQKIRSKKLRKDEELHKHVTWYNAGTGNFSCFRN